MILQSTEQIWFSLKCSFSKVLKGFVIFLGEGTTIQSKEIPPIEKNLDVKIVTSLYENIKKNSHHSQHIPDKEAVDTFLLCLLYNAMW